MRLRRPPNKPNRNTGPGVVSRRAVLAAGGIALAAAAAADDRYAVARGKDATVTDLSDLLIGRPSTPARPMNYRVGVIKAWDPDTAENTVTVDGADFTNLPILNTSEALALTPGAVVGIIDVGYTWAILGRMTIPGTPDAASVLDIFNFATADVSTGESTSSSTPGNLATPGPAAAVNIGPSGRCFVTLSAWMTWAAITETIGEMTFMANGPTLVLVNSSRSLRVGWASSGGGEFQGSRRLLLTGLLPGAYTFTAQYAQRGNVGNSVSFSNRNITVEPY